MSSLPQAPQPPRVAPELLSPAGDVECIRAAVENGADAVYFGLNTQFNARARAANLALDGLADLMAHIHRRGVRGYVALNTLVFPDELPTLEHTARRLIEAGVDAVIVQDLGVVRLLRHMCPQLEIHASTQMSLTSAEGIRVVEALGLARVILARELSLEEIRRIRPQTQMPLEVFVHGALCVAYSGQCLTSEAIGGRSANRGQCAQACRMPYDLVCDGETRDLGRQKYLLSPQDLAAYDRVPELIAAGVNSLKIEGRLKSAEYVANTTRYYRLAIDTAMAGRPVNFQPVQVQEIALSFSRGFSHGWLAGDDHKALVPGLSSSNRGVLLGTVERVERGRVHVRLQAGVKRGDGVAFETGRPDGTTPGGPVYEVFQGGQSLTESVDTGSVALTFAHGSIDFQELQPGQTVWKTSDPALSRVLRKTFASDVPQRSVPLEVQATAAVGAPLALEIRTATGVVCQVQSPQPLELARKHPLSAAVLAEQLARLGGTGYELRNLQARIDGAPMIPLSVLGKLRHEMVQTLDAAMSRRPERTLPATSVLDALREALCAGESVDAAPQLYVLCRRLEQVEPVLACGVEGVLVDFHDIRPYRHAVPIARAAGVPIFLATPRIHKPRENGIFAVLRRHQPDGLLVRNLAGLAFGRAHHLPCVADFSLNTANELAVAQVRRLGALRATASYDLSREQLAALVKRVPPAWLEVVIHQHMPMFHMEHCVFCAVLSPGTNKTNCGRPCDRHVVRLRDRIGAEHLLEADVGCRNTLYNAAAQSAAEVLPALRSHGVRHFRIELPTTADAAQAARLIRLYRELLEDRRSVHDAWRELRQLHPQGLTRGTLEEKREPLNGTPAPTAPHGD